MGSLTPLPATRSVIRSDEHPSGAARVVVTVAALAVVLSGCRLDVVAAVDVDADGSGEVAVSFHLDETLLDELDALGVDPTAELTAAALENDVWELERASTEHELTLTLRRAVADVEGFGDALRELTSGLADEDPALLVDVEVVVDDDGASQVGGVVSFRPPRTAGLEIDDEAFGPDADELQAIVERAVVPVLTVTLPGQPRHHDADEADGRTLRWVVPVAAERSIAAAAAPAAWWQLVDVVWLAIAGGVLLVLIVGLTVWGVRRRRRRGSAPAYVRHG